MAKPQETRPRSIDPQNRVVLPAEVMTALGVASGDHVAFEIEGTFVRIYRVRWIKDGK